LKQGTNPKNGLTKFLLWMVKANGIIWVFNLASILILSATGYNGSKLLASGYFPKMLLLETGVAFLIGGAMAFSGSIFPSKVREHFMNSKEKWSMENLRRNERKANMYIILAVLLFVQSLIVSLLS
jgi:hypothetical protein